MTFTWPAMLWFLLSLPLWVLLYLRVQQRRRRLAERYGSLGLVQASSGRQIGLRRHIPVMLFLAGLAILILALARPQAVVSLPRLEGTVILAFDVSGSMAAEDIPPNRMEAAKAAAQRFVDRQPDRVLVGVVAFSDSGLSVQAPTNEKEAILASIDRLAPERGTSLANGIYAALTTIATAGREPDTNYYSNQTPEPTPTPTPVPAGTYTSAVIVLLTDGENTVSPDPRRRLPQTAGCASTPSAWAARRGPTWRSRVSSFTPSSTKPCCNSSPSLPEARTTTQPASKICLQSTTRSARSWCSSPKRWKSPHSLPAPAC